MPTTKPFDPAEAESIIHKHASAEGPLLPILHELQAHFGYIAAEAVPVVASVLNLTRAEVHGVISFYHDFRTSAPGAKVVKLCLAEACQARGVNEVREKLESTLSVKMGETAADGTVTLAPVYCLGLCGNGPAALVEDRAYADLGHRGFDRCVKAVKS